MSHEPTLVTDLSQLRKGDVIEVRWGDVTTRGPVGTIHTGSGGETTRVEWITTPDGQTLWSGLFLRLRGSEVYLVSTAKPSLPATPGSVLTRAVIRGEEVEGPIILDRDGDWLTTRPVAGCWDHRAEDITDWTVGRVVEADTESE